MQLSRLTLLGVCAEQEDVSIKLIDTKDHLLSTYDRALSDYTGSYFKRQGIQVLSESHVRTQPIAASCALFRPQSAMSLLKLAQCGSCVFFGGCGRCPVWTARAS